MTTPRQPNGDSEARKATANNDYMLSKPISTLRGRTEGLLAYHDLDKHDGPTRLSCPRG
jgi:hypothetical protein